VLLHQLEMHQDFNPFKFILHAARIDQATPQMSLPASQAAQ
jgi:hypothetical protein